MSYDSNEEIYECCWCDKKFIFDDLWGWVNIHTFCSENCWDKYFEDIPKVKDFGQIYLTHDRD